MQNLPPPETLKLGGNKAEDWRRWKQKWINYVKASGLRTKPEEIQAATFLHVVGDEGLDIYNTFRWEGEGDENRPTVILEKFETYFVPRKNITFERHVFNKRDQRERESIDEYVKALRTLAKSCEYGELTDGIVKDRVIAGLREDRIRERLLERTELNLEEAIQMLKAVEVSKLHAKSFMMEQSETVDAEMCALYKQGVRKKIQPNNNGLFKPSLSYPVQREYRGTQHNYKRADRTEQKNDRYNDQLCGKCGLKHAKRNCPAWGNSCFKCQKSNHYARMCTSQMKGDERYNSYTRKTQKQVSTIGMNEEHTEEEDDKEVLFIGEVTIEGQRRARNEDWFEIVDLNNQKVRLKLDTGAQCNVISKGVYNKISDKPLRPSKVRLKSYTKEILKPIGEIELICTWKGTKYKITFQVVEGNYEAVLGRSDCEKMRMVTREIGSISIKDQKVTETRKDKIKGTILGEYPELFEGVGRLPGIYRIQIDESVQPVIHPPRRIPFAIRNKVKAELEKMESQEIIIKVPNNEPTDWVNSLVTVEKPNGDVRICLDPKDLNKAIKREHHPLNTVEEIASKVEGATIFTVLDAKNAFYQIQLDEDSSKLLTFNSPYGRYRYRRMPMGIKSAPEVYQRRIQQVLEGLEGVDTGMDDILVWGHNEKEHDSRLHKVLTRLREQGVKLNPKKCSIKEMEIKFHGHKFTAEGLKTNEAKCHAIREMPSPKNKDEVKRFMGMINYVGKFIPNLSQISAPVRELLCKNVEWHWQGEHERSFQAMKDALINPPVLAFYNPKEQLIMQVDASSKGVGAALLQGGRPVTYAYKTLSTCQQGYAQIEKEMLAILFGCTKFNDFIYGRETIVETDHKPLESIMKKPIFKAPVRLQRMMIQLQRYPGLTVVYKKGAEMHVADTLSRAHSQKTLRDIEELNINVIASLPMSTEKCKEFEKATEEDDTLQKVKEYILRGWPDKKSDLSGRIQEYWHYRDEMTIIDELIFKGERLVVPLQLRKEMLNKLHQSHLGIVKSKQRARNVFYWPGMNAEIEEVIKKCEVCATYQKDNVKEPLQSHKIPDRPWSKVGTDLFSLEGKDYLLCVDYRSKYPEIVQLNTLTSQAVVNGLKAIFSRHGIPEEVISDNGPQYSSYEFREFSKEWGFQHSTSSPYYPKSNGQAERTVQTMKNILKKAQDPFLALLEYRNTPLDGINATPAQLLMSRCLRSVLPVTRRLLKPKVITGVMKSLRKRQEKQKFYHDRAAKSLGKLERGRPIRYRHSKGVWKPAKVYQTLPNRSYVIKTDKGNCIRRSRGFLKESRGNPKKPRDEYIPETDVRVPNVKRHSMVRPVLNPRMVMQDHTDGQQGNMQHELEPIQEQHQSTRCGRKIKKPVRMNL